MTYCRWCENAIARTVREAGLSDSVGGLSCVSRVRTKVHMSTRTCVQRDMFGLQPSPLASYQCFWDVITGLLLQGRTRDAVV
jgi:hypothetical protein